MHIDYRTAFRLRRRGTRRTIGIRDENRGELRIRVFETADRDRRATPQHGERLLAHILPGIMRQFERVLESRVICRMRKMQRSLAH